MENIQIPDSYFDYILREKKAAIRLADYKNTGIWNEDSAYDDVYLTEDEVKKFGDIYRSKFFPKKELIKNIVTAYYSVENNSGIPAWVASDLSLFKSITIDNENTISLEDKNYIHTYQVTKNDFHESNNTISRGYVPNSILPLVSSTIILKTNQIIKDDDWFVLFWGFENSYPDFHNGYYYKVGGTVATSDNINANSSLFLKPEKIDDYTYKMYGAELTNIIANGAYINCCFLSGECDTVNGLSQSEIENYIIDTTVEVHSNIPVGDYNTIYDALNDMIILNEGEHIVKFELKENVSSLDRAFMNCVYLTNLEIPQCITYIEDFSFGSVQYPIEIMFKHNLDSLPQVDFNAFTTNYGNTNIRLYFPNITCEEVDNASEDKLEAYYCIEDAIYDKGYIDLNCDA